MMISVVTAKGVTVRGVVGADDCVSSLNEKKDDDDHLSV